MQNHRLVLPEHLNQFGFLFGGYLLKWVDELAWMSASLDYPECLFVTVGMKEVSFHKSVSGGSILRFESKQVHCGTTSVTYEVLVMRDSTEIFSTEVTLVHVDEKGQKQPVPAKDGA